MQARPVRGVPFNLLGISRCRRIWECWGASGLAIEIEQIMNLRQDALVTGRSGFGKSPSSARRGLGREKKWAKPLREKKSSLTCDRPVELAGGASRVEVSVVVLTSD